MSSELETVPALFVTGTGTGVGKTYLTRQLAEAGRERGIEMGIYKPVCSGAEFGPQGLQWADVEQAFEALRGTASRELICPQRFLAPLAPPVAARLEHRCVDEQLLVEGYRAWCGRLSNSPNARLLIEGAGGWLSPISQTQTVGDFAQGVGACVLIVAGQRLGVINQVLLTVEAIRSRGLEIAGVVLNAALPGGDLSSLSNLRELQRWTNLPIVAELERGASLPESICVELLKSLS